jgi:hypothetical protein
MFFEAKIPFGVSISSEEIFDKPMMLSLVNIHEKLPSLKCEVINGRTYLP